MPDVWIENGHLQCLVSTSGGVLWQLDAIADEGSIPLLRRPQGASRSRAATDAACFPLVPFGNRVEGNAFDFGGSRFELAANTPWDPHYVHGDGWLNEWHITSSGKGFVELTYSHDASPYQYTATQSFSLERTTLRVLMTVRNEGNLPMPFGLGWHPFFPLTPGTRLEAPASSCWTEKQGWLPDELRSRPPDLIFDSGSPLPRRWVNSGFEGWDGTATIRWLDRNLSLQVQTEPACSRYFLFVSSTDFDPNYRFDFFCFEPMTHSANGHHLPDLGGLKILQPSESLAASMSLTWSQESVRSPPWLT